MSSVAVRPSNHLGVQFEAPPAPAKSSIQIDARSNSALARVERHNWKAARFVEQPIRPARVVSREHALAQRREAPETRNVLQTCGTQATNGTGANLRLLENANNHPGDGGPNRHSPKRERNNLAHKVPRPRT